MLRARAGTDVLDGMILQLEQRRAAKAGALEECEKEEKKFMAWGISTLAATGFGIYANIKLHEKLSNMSGDGRRGGSMWRDMRPQEIINDESCYALCIDPDEDARSACGCQGGS